MLDLRLVKTYSADGSEDPEFIRDTIYVRIKSLDAYDGDTSDTLADLQEVVEVKRWTTLLELAQETSSLIAKGKMTFRQAFAIARILGCDAKPPQGSPGAEAQPQLNFEKLGDQVKSFFATEYDKVSKGKILINLQILRYQINPTQIYLNLI
jgi:hypothetical protein